jgi:N-acyl-D-aspartate/D-glutamate deacylase
LLAIATAAKRRLIFEPAVAALHPSQRDTDIAAMQKRGRMQEGMVADITILDLPTVRDKAAHATGTVPTTGILYVIVSGTMVVKDSEVLYEQSSLGDWVGFIYGDNDETRKMSHR